MSDKQYELIDTLDNYSIFRLSYIFVMSAMIPFFFDSKSYLQYNMSELSYLSRWWAHRTTALTERMRLRIQAVEVNVLHRVELRYLG